MKILTQHCDIFGKTKYLIHYSMFSANQPKTHSFSECTISNKSYFCGILSSTLWPSFSRSRKLSPLHYFQPHQLRQTTSTSTEHPLVGLDPHSSCGMLIKDHLLEYFLVIMIENGQELTISTNCMANDHQPSKEVLWNLKLSWFIHFPKMPTTAACIRQLIYKSSLATAHSNMGNDT